MHITPSWGPPIWTASRELVIDTEGVQYTLSLPREYVIDGHRAAG